MLTKRWLANLLSISK